MGNLLLNLGNSFLNQKGSVKPVSPDALPVLLPDLIVTTALWLVVMASMLLIFNPNGSPYYKHRAAMRAATPTNGTGGSRPAREQVRAHNEGLDGFGRLRPWPSPSLIRGSSRARCVPDRRSTRG